MANNEATERVKPIVLHDHETGMDYTLEFDRDSVRFAEDRGFDPADVVKYPMTKIPELFFFSFRMHHKNIARANTDHILFDVLGGMPDGMAERLGALYAAPFEALKNSGDTAKNSRMTVEM